MGDFYRVIKTIKGHRYVYRQRTFRVSGRVRTESHYERPAGSGDVARIMAEQQIRQGTPNHGQVAAAVKRLADPVRAASTSQRPFGPPGEVNTTFVRHPATDRHVAALGARVIEHNNAEGAFYNPGHDAIVMPAGQRFRERGKQPATASYYATLLHELAHWSGSSARLGRTLIGMDQVRTREDVETYCREELVAEATAVLLMGKLGVPVGDESQHARYFQGYLGQIRNKEEALEYVMNEAHRAAGYILASPQMIAIKVQYGLV